MSSPADIRAWAREEGFDPPVRGPLPAEIRSAWADHLADAYPDGMPGDDEIIGLTAPAGEQSSPAAGAAAAAAGEAERAPQEAPREPGRRVRAALGQAATGARRGRPPKKPPRVPLEDLGQTAWSAAAGAMMFLAARRAPRLVPVATVLAYQAPAAGPMTEQTLKGTPADAVLQAPARMIGAFKSAKGLLGLPAMATACCLYPDIFPMMRQPMIDAAKDYVILAGPMVREAREREEAYQRELALQTEAAGGEVMTAEELIDAAFAPLMQALQAERAAANGDGGVSYAAAANGAAAAAAG